MPFSHPTNRILLATSVVATLAISGCKMGLPAQQRASPDSPVSLNQVAPGEQSVVSAAKSNHGIDPRSLEEAASAPAGPQKPSAPVSEPPLSKTLPPPKEQAILPLPKDAVIVRPDGSRMPRQTKPVDPIKPVTAIQDVTAAKFNADVQTLRDLQHTLENFNLKMVRVTEGQSSFIDWDQDRLDAYDGRFETALPALKRFKAAAVQFLRSYDRKFTVDGSLEKHKELMSGPMAVLVSKIQLVTDTIAEIERPREDDDNDFDYHMGAIEKFFARL